MEFDLAEATLTRPPNEGQPYRYVGYWWPSQEGVKELLLRVLPHSSTPAILSEALLRMRVLPLPPLVHLGLGPQRGSASRGGGLPDTLSAGRRNPIFAKCAFVHG